MIKKGKPQSILTGGHFPYNALFNKPIPQYSGGWFEYIFTDTNFNVDDIEILLELLDIDILLNNPNTIQNFLDRSSLPDKTKLRCGSLYNNEREFFKYTQLEAYNRFGIPCKYYKVNYNTKEEPVFGENSNMVISEMYSDVMIYCKLPRETKVWSKFGIEYGETFPMFCSKEHFKFASNSYIPQMGDYIMIDFNGNIYEIVEIKEEIAGYIQSKQYSWNFIVKPFKVKSNVTLSPNLSNTPIAKYIGIKDIFDITNTVDVKNENVAYKPKIGEKAQKNPWQV